MSLLADDNERKQESNEEVDRFSILMFGNSRHRKTYKEGGYNYNSPEISEQKEQLSFNRTLTSFNRTSNRIDDWFFGSGRKEPETSTYITPNQIESLLNNLDLDLLMETFDMFVTTFEQYKPLFKEFTPFINRFSKQLKSNKDA